MEPINATRAFGSGERGVDARPEDRPGVPRETPPHPVGSAHWDTPPAQPRRGQVTRRMEQGGKLPPVFGTAQPPRGLSGQLRMAAYGVPEHQFRHWLLLVLADHIDVAESRSGLSSGWRWLSNATWSRVVGSLLKDTRPQARGTKGDSR